MAGDLPEWAGERGHQDRRSTLKREVPAMGAVLSRIGEKRIMDKRLISPTPLFRLVRLVLPEHLLLRLFGRRIPIAADRRAPRR
jgi:hypothetical protein